MVKWRIDVLCLQETKLQPDQYPAEAFEALDIKHIFTLHRRKGIAEWPYWPKIEPDHIEYGMGIEEYDNEGRFIRADLATCRWWGLSFGYERRWTSGLRWFGLKRFKSMWPNCENPVRIWFCGIIIFVMNPSIFMTLYVMPPTVVSCLKNGNGWLASCPQGLSTPSTLYPEKQEYTWWSYRFNSRAKNKVENWLLYGKRTGALFIERGRYPEQCRSFHCPMALKSAELFERMVILSLRLSLRHGTHIGKCPASSEVEPVVSDGKWWLMFY